MSLCGLTHAEILALPVFLGNRQRRLGEFFEVEGDGATSLELHGDLAKVKWIGKGMTRADRVHGNAGMHLGSGMSGGTISVHGNAGDWLGAEMTGGLIHVHGNVRRAGRRGLSRQPRRHARRKDPRRRRGRHRGRHAHAARPHHGPGPRRRLRRPADEGRHPGPARRSGHPGRRLDGEGRDRRPVPLKLLPTFLYACTYEPTFLRVYTDTCTTVGCRRPNPGGVNSTSAT